MPNVITNGNAQHIVVQHHYQVSPMQKPVPCTIVEKTQKMSQDGRMFRKKERLKVANCCLCPRNFLSKHMARTNLH